ncbi:MAG: DNA pilot protein [Microviridae sp.]|nr:MAG: DNA pilot protein [Microviridae sp.]
MLQFIAPILGSLASGAMSLIGGQKANEQKAAGQEREIELQKEFAQNGLRWKVEDAQRAGVHPLAALGATGAQYSPVGLGDNDTAASFSAAGQDFSRAIDATRTQPERMGAIGAKMQTLGLERASLENDLLRAQILDITRPRTPPFPLAGTDYAMPGQPASGGLKVAGVPIVKDKGWSDAQDVEDRYGDLVQMVYGAGVLGADGLKHVLDGLPAARDTYSSRPVRGSQFYK